MSVGIYLIKSIQTNEIYIGQSVNVNRRIGEHKRLLKKQAHYNEYLQNHYIKYGIQDLSFEVIENCKIEDLDNREKYWINIYNANIRKYGFNLDSGGSEGKIFSEERRLSITGTKNPMYGKKHSQEFINYITIHNRGNSDKLSEKDVEEIKQSILKSISQKELSDKYNVKISTINKIAMCKNWGWVSSDLNNELLKYSSNTKEERTNRMKKLYAENKTINEIAEIENLDITSVYKFFKEETSDKKDNLKNRDTGVLQEYRIGSSKEKICEMFNISDKVFHRITFEERSNDKVSLKNKVVELYKGGMKNKDISIKLNLHRTTITEWIKSI